MITCYTAPVLSAALKKLKDITAACHSVGTRTVIFCEDRLTLAAERTVCAAVGGTFWVSVYTFARFLSAEHGKCQNLLTSQGSAMAVRSLIEANRSRLTMFKKLSSATAAQDIYDTIALLYSSRVTPDDLAAAHSPDPVLEGKMRDLELLYRAYTDYLAESGNVDRNRYLAMLPQIIAQSPTVRGANVIFLGFQTLTCAVAECLSACMDVAKNVTGIFIGGSSDVYVNEASASFMGIAKGYGGANRANLAGGLVPEAEHLRRHIFNPESFHTATPMPTSAVRLFAGRDQDDELEYIAANIIRCAIEEGVRYRDISVMLPDVQGYAPALARMFGEYSIPYYLDRRYRLSEHPVCAFLEGFLNCAADGCTPQSVAAVVSSPLFVVGSGRREGERRKDKDVFGNYMLRLAGYRGGVKRAPKPEVLEALNLDISAVQRVREPFLQSLARIPAKGTGSAFCAALRGVMDDFNAPATLEAMGDEFSGQYPSLAALSARSYEAVCAVLDEAEKLVGGQSMPVREFAKILKSGFSATELSLIPPKQDAVFVGDLSGCANTGSAIVFVAGLTGDVPASGDDTAILTDRDITSLGALNIKISPKIAQVDSRSRETAGLNLCAFSRELHLCYPVRRGGEEAGISRIIDYACALFRTAGGEQLAAVDGARFMAAPDNLKYLCSRPAPALRQLAAQPSPAVRSAIYALLCQNGYTDQADCALAVSTAGGRISCGDRLYGTSLSPTVLESYFSCPYKCFMLRGLRLAEREEGVMRPLDCGNFIHTVLQRVFGPANPMQDEEQVAGIARGEAQKLLAEPKYSALSADKRGEYAAQALTEECVAVCLGAYEQLKNSTFTIAEVEKTCRLPLDGGLSLYGRIDRVDTSGSMVRVIDYKTGAIDSSAPLYYMGLKLQLPIYLLASSQGKRPVGAYYFPAALTYEEQRDGVYRLSGYMDGSEDVVRSTDTTVEEKCKSRYVDAYLNGRIAESVLEKDDFADFLTYSSLVARRGAAEMTAGNVAPSPAPDACSYCPLAGSCGFTSADSPRSRQSINCRGIAKIVQEERGG